MAFSANIGADAQADRRGREYESAKVANKSSEVTQMGTVDWRIARLRRTHHSLDSNEIETTSRVV